MKLLFYNDSLGYGGHEIMALTIIRELSALSQPLFLACSEANTQLLQEAEKIGNLTVCRLARNSYRFPLLTNIVNPGQLKEIRNVIRETSPDCVVAVQGVIEISSACLLAAKRENVKVVSYIALAKKMKSLNVPLGFLRDIIDLYYYRLPDRFITISSAQRQYLMANGVAEGKIAVIPNVVRLDVAKRCDRAVARKLLGMSESKAYFAIVGRVDVKTKGHGYLVEAVLRGKERLGGIVFLVVGDGPDLETFKASVAANRLDDHFHFLPWMDDMNLVYSAVDAVVIPSNHESVPLVMTEACLYGLPVIATNADGMKDNLPAEWLFEKGDIDQIIARAAYIRDSDQADLCDSTKQRFESVFLRRTIGSEFIAEIEKVKGHSGQLPYHYTQAVGAKQ